ncbi:MAG TPA: class II aldolase/adducin family protein [Syntrophorhabdaceae bacterium]|nr:class II aldolase/adducin family protein [Syntrophorhabdaceae bacterium]
MGFTVNEEYFTAFIDACHHIARHGLVLCSSGNLSFRIDDELMLITATGTWLSEMNKDDIAVCRISDGKCLCGNDPSMELTFHRGILSQRKDVNVVLHFQAPFATAMACSKDVEYDRISVVAEIPYYIGPVSVVPYAPPGSTDLAAQVISAVHNHDLVVLKNHGQVTVGRTFQEAIQRAAYFELACSIYLRAADKLQTLEKEQIETLYAARRA